MKNVTFAALQDASDELSYSRGVRETNALFYPVLCALGEAADNAVGSEYFAGNAFVMVRDNQSPLFNAAALASLETVMACNVLDWDSETHANVSAWFKSHGFTY